MSNIINVTEDTFEDVVLKSDIPVLVDFWAEWCGPCKMMLPVLEEAVEEYEGKVKFVKVNVDHASSIAAKYNVRGIPTSAILKSGELSEFKVGVMTKSALNEFLDKHAQ